MRPQNLESQSWKVCLNLSKQAACHSLWGLNYVTDSRPFPPLPLPKSGLLLPGLQKSASNNCQKAATFLFAYCTPQKWWGTAMGLAQLKPYHFRCHGRQNQHSGTTRKVHPQRPQVGSLILVWLKAIQRPWDNLISDFQQRYSQMDP